VKELAVAVGGPAKLVPLVFKVAAGRAAEVMQDLEKQFAEVLRGDGGDLVRERLRLDELQLNMPLICNIEAASVGKQRVPMKLLPPQTDADPVAEYNEYMVLKGNLMVYGILLEEWNAAAAVRFKVVEQRHQEVQDNAAQRLQQAATERLVGMAQEAASNLSLGTGVTAKRGGRVLRGSLSGAGAVQSPLCGSAGNDGVKSFVAATPGMGSVSAAMKTAGDITNW
jgi:hypothetical protein